MLDLDLMTNLRTGAGEPLPWDEAHEQAVDAIESVLYQKALSGDTICMIFYLKAHRMQYRDRLNVDVKQLDREIEERLAELKSISPIDAQKPSSLLSLPPQAVKLIL